MSDYEKLYQQGLTTLRKYSLGSMAEGIDIPAIHELIRKNREKLLAISSFQKGKELADGILSKACSFPIQINSFIKDEKDVELLYNILVSWRDSILAVEKA
jgi:hypothetical protein